MNRLKQVLDTNSISYTEDDLTDYLEYVGNHINIMKDDEIVEDFMEFIVK